MASVIVDVTGRIARLFQDDPREFVVRRNTLARDLARAGQKELSTRIRSLTRPSTSAWLVNQLYWHERAEYDALLAAGAAARDAQQSRLSGRGGDLVRALAERDAIIGRLAGQAERLAAAGGVAVSADVRSRLRTTLEAIALRAGDTSVSHGQLSEDVALPGLQALAGLVLRTDQPETSAPRPALALVEESSVRRDAREEREALEQELAAVVAERELARVDLTSARDAAEVADGAVMAARQQVQAAQRALEAAQTRVQQAATFEAAAVARAAATTAAAAAAEQRDRDLDAREAAVSKRLQGLAAARRLPATTRSPQPQPLQARSTKPRPPKPRPPKLR